MSVVLSHGRRCIVHFNVTKHPSAEWTGRQLSEAFPWNTAPRLLIGDRDGNDGHDLTRRVNAPGIEPVLLAPRSPWQNPQVDRVSGSSRRERLDHVVVFNEDHLPGILKSYLCYHHASRSHLSLGQDAPTPREVKFRNSARSSSSPRSAESTTDIPDERPDNS